MQIKTTNQVSSLFIVSPVCYDSTPQKNPQPENFRLQSTTDAGKTLQCEGEADGFVCFAANEKSAHEGRD